MLCPMAQKTAPSDLTGSLLIAMPGMADPHFDGSVVFLCSHSADGAMGLVINKPIPDLSLAEMLKQLDIPSENAPKLPVCFGGPVDTNRGFILHDDTARRRGSSDSFLQVGPRFAMSSTMDVLEDVARGQGPANAIMALGYAGWDAQQLEAEIALNGWLTCEARAELVFSHDMDGKWEQALATLGVDPLLLSTQAGRA